MFATQPHDGGLTTMASAMRKMAVYLGLVEDDHRYDEPYADEYGEADDYGDYVTEYSDHAGAPEANGGYVADYGRGRPHQRSPSDNRHTYLAKITTLHPPTYNEARTISEHLFGGNSVIMKPTESVGKQARTLR